MSTQSQAPKVLAHLRVTNEAMARFQDHLEKDAATRDAVSAKVPEAVEALVSNERIFGHQSDEVAEKIASSHEACIELIRDLACHPTAAKLDAIRSPAGSEKTEGARPITGQLVADFDETASGQAFRDKLMGGR